MSDPTVVLPDEVEDITTNELHGRILELLLIALRTVLQGQAAVIQQIFIRVEHRVQASPDVLIAMGSEPGTRTVYHVPPEPVPDVTIEVMSPANASGEGRALLDNKRALFGVIGVPLHVEVDPDGGYIAVWESRNSELVRTDVCTSYTSPAIGGLRIETPAPGVVHVYWPDGELVDLVGTIARRWEADAALRRVADLEAKLRELGVDPADA